MDSDTDITTTSTGTTTSSTINTGVRRFHYGKRGVPVCVFR